MEIENLEMENQELTEEEKKKKKNQILKSAQAEAIENQFDVNLNSVFLVVGLRGYGKTTLLKKVVQEASYGLQKEHVRDFPIIILDIASEDWLHVRRTNPQKQKNSWFKRHSHIYTDVLQFPYILFKCYKLWNCLVVIDDYDSVLELLSPHPQLKKKFLQLSVIIALQGRHHGVGLWVGSHRFSTTPKAIVSQAEKIISFRQHLDIDRKRWKDVTGSDADIGSLSPFEYKVFP